MAGYSIRKYGGKRRTRYRRKRNLKALIRAEAGKVCSAKLETHVLDTAIDQEASNTTPAIASLTAVATGDDRANREGIEIIGKSLNFKYVLTGADTTQLVRVMIVRWYDADDPTINEILENVTTPSLSMVSAYQADPTHKYKILYDRTHSLVQAGSNAVAASKGALNLKGHKFHFSGAASTTETDALYLIHFSDSGAVTHPDISFFSRFRFNP